MTIIKRKIIIGNKKLTPSDKWVRWRIGVNKEPISNEGKRIPIEELGNLYNSEEE